MHVAFALRSAGARAPVTAQVREILWHASTRWLMTFVIVVTANHFIVDALLGALTAGPPPTAPSWLARAPARCVALLEGPRAPAHRERLAAGAQTARRLAPARRAAASRRARQPAPRSAPGTARAGAATA